MEAGSHWPSFRHCLLFFRDAERCWGYKQFPLPLPACLNISYCSCVLSCCCFLPRLTALCLLEAQQANGERPDSLGVFLFLLIREQQPSGCKWIKWKTRLALCCSCFVTQGALVEQHQKLRRETGKNQCLIDRCIKTLKQPRMAVSERYRAQRYRFRKRVTALWLYINHMESCRWFLHLLYCLCFMEALIIPHILGQTLLKQNIRSTQDFDRKSILISTAGDNYWNSHTQKCRLKVHSCGTNSGIGILFCASF